MKFADFPSASSAVFGYIKYGPLFPMLSTDLAMKLEACMFLIRNYFKFLCSVLIIKGCKCIMTIFLVPKDVQQCNLHYGLHGNKDTGIILKENEDLTI